MNVDAKPNCTSGRGRNFRFPPESMLNEFIEVDSKLTNDQRDLLSNKFRFLSSVKGLTHFVSFVGPAVYFYRSNPTLKRLKFKTFGVGLLSSLVTTAVITTLTYRYQLSITNDAAVSNVLKFSKGFHSGKLGWYYRVTAQDPRFIINEPDDFYRMRNLIKKTVW